MHIPSFASGREGFVRALHAPSKPMRERRWRACCIAIFALTVLFFYQPVAGQTLGLYAGGMEMRDTGKDKSHAWELEYMEQLAPHFGLSLLYLNEGHPHGHHRDGFGTQAWFRTSPLGGRFSVAAGVGPYYYFDTIPREQANYANKHGYGLIYSLATDMQVDDRWSLQLRLSRVDARRQFDTNVVLLGIGYRFQSTPPRSSDAALYTATKTSEITVLAGQTIVNSLESTHGPAASIEYRRASHPHLEWSVGFLKQGDGHRVRGEGITTQGWLTQSTPDNRVTFGFGLGPYLAVNRRDAGSAEKSDRLAGMVSLSARYRLTPQWHTRATWNRVSSNDDRDTDVLLIGLGYTY